MTVYEFPTSLGQRRMWLLAQMDPGEPTYHIGWAVWLDGPLDVDALQQAWDAAVTRHEALRTTFRNDSGVPVQVIEDEPEPAPLAVTVLDGVDDAEQAARDLIYQLARAPMSLEIGPLVRPSLVRLGPQRHVLAVVMHHIVADGWSFRILFDELSADYEAVRSSGSLTSQEPPIQYADFAMWQLEHAEDGGYAAAERFWRGELADAPGPLPLPTDEPYPARQTFAAADVDTTIDPALVSALRGAAAEHQTTLFAVLLGAYAAVLARFTGSDDLLIAVPMAARTRPETETVVGLFMNTVAIRVRVDQDRPVSELIASVHAATARALAHQELPFARVVELTRPDRDQARLPLVQVMFAMEESWSVPERGDLRWRPELVRTDTSKFELEVTVTDAQLQVNYNRDLFHAATGERVAAAIERMLHAVAETPQLAVGDVPIMPDATYDLVTRVWPETSPVDATQGGVPRGGAAPDCAAPDGGHGRDAHEAAAGVPDPGETAAALLWAACTGDATVAEGPDGALTGAQIRARAQEVAAALRQHGVGVGDRVAILVERGVRILPSILGVWALGAAYVPLDPIYPAQRLATMLADAGVRAVIVDSGAPEAPEVPQLTTPTAVVDLADPVQSGAGAVTPAWAPPGGAAYTMFTSGSTGRPKAVTVTQGGVATLLRALQPRLALVESDRFVAVSTFAFDIALVELVAPVLAGARVIVADADHARDAARLRDFLAERGATAMQATPATWRMLIDAGGVPPKVSLRLSAGEALPRDLADVLRDRPDVRLWNLYGPTETTIFSGGALVDAGPIEIGSIIPGTHLYVLDEGLRPVPPGVLGEVYIGGLGLAQGYHDAPGLTADRFVPNPISISDPHRPTGGARLYRTGDLGRWRDSGRIELAGRADRQVKIRGYRVESGEVEAALRAQPEITEAVVSVWTGAGSHDVRLIGYLVTRDDDQKPPSDLRERLREVLPDYMVPSTFVVVAQMPQTASGKIDFRALPEPDWTATSASAGGPVAPRTPVEAELAGFVAELLTLSAPVGVTDNFFALGGHSLTATRLMARVRAAYGVDLPVRALFADPTVAGLAAAIDAASPATSAARDLATASSPASGGSR